MRLRRGGCRGVHTASGCGPPQRIRDPSELAENTGNHLMVDRRPARRAGKATPKRLHRGMASAYMALSSERSAARLAH